MDAAHRTTAGPDATARSRWMALAAALLMGLFGGSFPAAGSILSGIYLLGAAFVWLCPETTGLRERSEP